MPMTSPIAPGQNYKPTNCLSGAGVFPPPAPAVTYGNPGCTGTPPGDTFASQFSGFNPNGNWSLYTVDALDPDMSPKPLGAASFIGGWGIQFLTPTAEPISIEGRVVTSDGQGISRSTVTLMGNGEPMRTVTNPFGYYRFTGLLPGNTYVISVAAKKYQFDQPNQVVSPLDNIADLDFIALPN